MATANEVYAALTEIITFFCKGQEPWKRDTDKRPTFYTAIRAALGVMTPDQAEAVIALFQAEHAAWDARMAAPWTLEEVEQYLISGAGEEMTPMWIYWNWVRPHSSIRPPIPKAMYIEAWRNVVSRDAVHLSYNYIRRPGPDTKTDAGSKQRALLMTFDDWPEWEA